MYVENRDCNIYFLDKLNQIKHFNREKNTIATTYFWSWRKDHKKVKKLKLFFLLWQKMKWKKISIFKCDFCCHLRRLIQSKPNLRTCNLWTGWNISFKYFDWICSIQLAKSLSDKMAKKIHICKWMISFAILTFVIKE